MDYSSNGQITFYNQFCCLGNIRRQVNKFPLIIYNRSSFRFFNYSASNDKRAAHYRRFYFISAWTTALAFKFLRSAKRQAFIKFNIHAVGSIFYHCSNRWCLNVKLSAFKEDINSKVLLSPLLHRV